MNRLRSLFASLLRREATEPVPRLTAQELHTVENLIVAGESMRMQRSEARDFSEEELIRAAWADLAIEDPSLDLAQAQELLAGSTKTRELLAGHA